MALPLKVVFSHCSTVLWPSILRWCSVTVQPSYGPAFLSILDVPGVNFQQMHVGRQSVLPGLPRPVDRRLPLHHQHSACLHKIGIALFSTCPSHLSLTLLITSPIA